MVICGPTNLSDNRGTQRGSCPRSLLLYRHMSPTLSSTRVHTAESPAEHRADKEGYFFLLFSPLMEQPKEQKLENYEPHLAS